MGLKTEWEGGERNVKEVIKEVPPHLLLLIQEVLLLVGVRGQEGGG